MKAEGVRIAREVIDNGLAAEKLEALVDFTGDKTKLAAWKKKATV